MVKQNLNWLKLRIAGSFQNQSLSIKTMGMIVARFLALSWLGSVLEPEIVNISAISPHNYRSFVVTMFKEMVDQFYTELILPSELHDTVLTQQVNTDEL